jgi:molecular chaperone GrpE
MTEKKESAADKAIREALESVERFERERKTAPTSDAAAADGESTEVLPAVAMASIPEDGGADPETTANNALEHTETLASVTSGTGAGTGRDPVRKTAEQAMIESMIKARGEMQQALEQTQKEAKDMFERLARVSADFENFKKRVGREKDEAIKFGNEKAFKEIIPVVDNFRRALQAAPADGGTFVEGVRLVAKQLEDSLSRFGVVGFDSLGQPFDPARHEAVGSRTHETIAAQHVCEEYQRGYLLHDRLLRPALVIVSSGVES